MAVDYNFLQTLNLKLVQGRNFDAATAADFDNNIINETAAERFNLGPDPIGRHIISGTDSLNNPLKVRLLVWLKISIWDLLTHQLNP